MQHSLWVEQLGQGPGLTRIFVVWLRSATDVGILNRSIVSGVITCCSDDAACCRLSTISLVFSLVHGQSRSGNAFDHGMGRISRGEQEITHRSVSSLDDVPIMVVVVSLVEGRRKGEVK